MDSQVPGRKPALTPAAFLVRGLLAGLLAGLIAFAVAFAFGEPHVDDAIALEEAAAAHLTHEEVAAEEAAAAEPGMVEISRERQKSWGLLTGTAAVGTALGGLVALASAAVVGRLGRLSARGATLLVAGAGFVAVALVPFLKYPATPPAVGDPDTINGRTVEYFALLLVSVLAAIAAVVIGRRLLTRFDGVTATLVAAAGYVAVVSVAGLLLPGPESLGSFPADTLWSFRRASVLTLASLWATIAVVLTILVGRLHDAATADAERRALAASL
ncbi:CbtA family protein [Nocardioides stalactiti]|uniref:CbtA family protein n=1 Tax=Nocardioides stalactiti TaxID=2755356 RepID=UPI0016037740|nr:CbtA family protein [Nocardioides stalactiti]